MSRAETKATVICTNPNLAATLNESHVPCISALDRPIHHYAPALYLHSPQVVLADWHGRWESSYQDARKDFLALCKRVEAPSLPGIPIPDQRHFYAAVAAGQIVAVAFAEEVLVDIRLNVFSELRDVINHEAMYSGGDAASRLESYISSWKCPNLDDARKKWAKLMSGPLQDACRAFRDVCALQPGKETIRRAGLQLCKCFWDDLAPEIARMPPIPSLSTSGMLGLLPLGRSRPGMSGSAGICINLLPVPEERYECVPSAAGWLSRLTPLFTQHIRSVISTARGPYWTKPGEEEHDLFGKVNFEKAVTLRYDVSPRRVHAVPLVLDLIRRWLACAVFIDKGLVLVLPECRDLKAKVKLIRLLTTELWEPIQEWIEEGTQQTVQPPMASVTAEAPKPVGQSMPAEALATAVVEQLRPHLKSIVEAKGGADKTAETQVGKRKGRGKPKAGIPKPTTPASRFRFDPGQALVDGRDLSLPAGLPVDVLKKLVGTWGRTVAHRDLHDTSGEGEASDELRDAIRAIREALKRRKISCKVRNKRGAGYLIS